MGLFPALPVKGHQDTTLNFEKLQREIGADWTNPESFSAKLEETATVQVRREWGRTVGRLKGEPKSKEALVPGTHLFTLPAGFRPLALIYTLFTDATGGVALVLRVQTTGVTENTTEVAINHVLSFDGVTFNLS